MEAISRSKITVLIVGAGPTGLTLANILSKSGIAVRIIEKKRQLSRHTKATNLMQRNQEVLFALGLLEPLNEISGSMRRLMVHSYGRCFGPRTMRLKESPFQDVLLCGQHNFEAVMAKGLEGSGVSIEFATELTHLEPTGDGVIARLRAFGGSEEVDCDFVVGCDGASGVTKTFTKLDFQVKKTGVAIRQVDCKLTWRRLSTMDQMWLFYFENGFAAIVPLPGGIHRILTIEPKPNIPEREPTLGEIQSKLREVVDDETATLSEPEWFSYTDLSMGIAPGLRDGRIFLAGDVGNPILPNGGQGMNTGISDAFNLGWKLASVINQGVDDGLLDTYNQERHALRNALEKAQFNSLKYTTLVTPRWMQAIFRLLAEPLLNLGGEYRMAQAFSQLKINTRNSPLTLELMGRKGLRAGDRVLQAEVVERSESRTLYEILYQGRWTLLAFAGTNKSDNRALLDAVAALDCVDLARYVVCTDSGLESDIPILYDLDEVAHRVYEVTRPTLYLIRPDGHVGARVAPKDVARLRDYARRWLPAAPKEARSRRREPIAVS